MANSMGPSLILLMTFLMAGSVSGQDCLREGREKYQTCSSCLVEAGAGCGWCLDQDSTNFNLAKGCQANTSHCTNWYSEQESSNILQDDPIGGDTNIQPQRITLQLKPNKDKVIEFKTKKKQNPVDMYFLLDLSGSMDNHRKQLITTPQSLIKVIGNRTKDYQFGFGAFREKPIIPMGKDEYPSFEHLQKLTNRTEDVERAIRDSETKPNYDTPESGLDGLLQEELVLLCEDEIGWRTDATRIIVFITDAPCHIAGDGIMAGLWKPYEHVCSLRRNESRWEYRGLDNDYPSLSEVDYWLNKKDTTVVFGVPKNILPLYKMFVDEEVITHGKAGDIGTDGQALKQIIAETYEEIDGELNIQLGNVEPPKVKDLVKVTMGSKKNCEINKEKDEVLCRNVTVSDVVSVTASIRLDPKICRVLEDSNISVRKITVDFRVFGQKSEKLNIDIEPVCECDSGRCRGQSDNAVCNREDSGAVNECGSCVCDQKEGITCQCSPGGGGGEALEAKCFAPTDNKRRCSGHGSCYCGSCNCDPGYVGDFCNCEIGEDDCGKPQGRGRHVCNNGKTECQCNTGWSHPEKSCSCSDKTDKCQSSQDKAGGLCSGRGECECNQCTCKQGFSGKFCQIDDSEDQEQMTCDRMEPCVLKEIYSKNESVPAVFREAWTKNCDEAVAKMLFCQISYSTGQSNTTNSTGDIQTDEGNEQQDLGLPCSLGERNEAEGHKECNFNLEFSDCFLATKGLDHDEFYGTNKKVFFYVTYTDPEDEEDDDEDDESPVPEIRCPKTLDWMLVILYSVGSGCGLFAIGFISYFILINLMDYLEYRGFNSDAKNAWEKGDVVETEMRSSGSKFRQSLRNRLSVKFTN